MTIFPDICPVLVRDSGHQGLETHGRPGRTHTSPLSCVQEIHDLEWWRMIDRAALLLERSKESRVASNKHNRFRVASRISSSLESRVSSLESRRSARTANKHEARSTLAARCTLHATLTIFRVFNRRLRTSFLNTAKLLSTSAIRDSPTCTLSASIEKPGTGGDILMFAGAFPSVS